MYCFDALSFSPWRHSGLLNALSFFWRNAQMNAIDKLISLANVRGSLDLRCQFQGDWAMDHGQQALGTAPYHIVLAGECRVEFADGRRLPMRAGDILLLPRGAPHVMHSPGKTVTPTSPRILTGGTLPIHRIGGASAELDMLCGGFHFNRASLLFGALPEYLVIPSGALPANGPLPALVEVMRAEADGNKVGARFLLDALSQALFTLILRAHLASQGQDSGSLALLGDKRLGPGLAGNAGGPCARVDHPRPGGHREHVPGQLHACICQGGRCLAVGAVDASPHGVGLQPAQSLTLGAERYCRTGRLPIPGRVQQEIQGSLR